MERGGSPSRRGRKEFFSFLEEGGRIEMSEGRRSEAPRARELGSVGRWTAN